MAVFNLYYNRMGMVTSTIPLESKSTSITFIEEVLDIINPSQHLVEETMGIQYESE